MLYLSIIQADVPILDQNSMDVGTWENSAFQDRCFHLHRQGERIDSAHS